jgi:hypothetical protein
MVQTALSPCGIRCLPTECQKCANTSKAPANIAQAPLSRTVVGRPFAAASQGHVIIQCVPMGIAGLALSEGFVLLLCVAPHSM